MEVKGVVARKAVGSIRPEELSTRITCLREGMAEEERVELERSEIRASRMGIFERGGLKGRFVSVPMIKWVAERWLRADMIWVALNAGLRGTSIAPILNSAYVTVANSMLFPRCTQTRSPLPTPRDCSPCARTLLF